MIKIAAAELIGLLIKTAGIIRDQNQEIARLKAELAEKHRHEHAEKIAHIAVSRGIMPEDQAVEYAESLARSSRDLAMVEEFVAHNGGVGTPLGQAEITKTASDHTLATGSQAEAEFVDFLLSADH